jgi:hypothetical protein
MTFKRHETTNKTLADRIRAKKDIRREKTLDRITTKAIHKPTFNAPVLSLLPVVGHPLAARTSLQEKKSLKTRLNDRRMERKDALDRAREKKKDEKHDAQVNRQMDRQNRHELYVKERKNRYEKWKENRAPKNERIKKNLSKTGEFLKQLPDKVIDYEARSIQKLGGAVVGGVADGLTNGKGFDGSGTTLFIVGGLGVLAVVLLK